MYKIHILYFFANNFSNFSMIFEFKAEELKSIKNNLSEINYEAKYDIK